MKTMLMTRTRTTALADHVVSTHSAYTAPDLAVQGTGVPVAGTSALLAQVAFGARVSTLPGLPPRGAPV